MFERVLRTGLSSLRDRAANLRCRLAALRFNPSRERIVAVAIKYGDGIMTVPAPARHNHVIAAVGEWFDATTRGDDPQGFVTSEGRFVDRELGLQIANAAGQVREKHGNPKKLFSEDMW